MSTALIENNGILSENHHLWKNNGTWFIQYMTYPSPGVKKRIRRSLGTRCVQNARDYRDELLSRIY